jgi:tetratricopeptide (TPR) repeat protein
LFRGSGEAQSLALLTDTNSTDLLTLLDASIQNDDSVMMLFDWEKETRSWRSLLMARVYARMFYSSSIGIFEAQELCQQMLLAVRSLPNSSLQQDYEITYSTILAWLQGSPSVPTSLSSVNSALQHSHSYALSLFHQAMQEQTSKSHPELIEVAFNNRQGWLELDDYKFEEGKFIVSSSGYLLYFFPAVRLALAAIGKYTHLVDPASSFMVKRVESFRVINDNSIVFREPLTTDKQRLEHALKELERRLKTVSQDERLLRLCGDLLLRLNRLEEAEEALNHCLHLPLCVHKERASALYDLACVLARGGREAECRLALEDSNQLHPLDKAWMQKDSDLESVWGSDWFKILLEK